MAEYREIGLDYLADVMELYEAAGWTAYLDDRDMLARAFDNSLWMLGAFEDGRLVGFLRCVGDGEHVVLVQDLLVHADFQRRGIGRCLLERAMERFSHVRMFTLLTDAADPVSNAFYSAASMLRHGDCGIAGYLRAGN